MGGPPPGYQPAHAWPGQYAPMEWVPVKPLRGLANAVCILLGVVALIDLLAAVALFRRAALVDDFTLSDVLSGRLEDADDFVQVSLGLFGLASLATGIVFIVWFARARSNTEAWYGPSATMSKGWAIGGWFIPLANFVIPKIVAHDIWKRSDPQSAVPGGRSSKALLWWWWIIYTIAGLMFFGSVSGRETEEDLDNGDITLSEYVDSAVASDTVAGVALLVQIAAAVLAILVVQRITTMQDQRMGLQPMPGMYPGGVPAPGGPGYPGGGFGAPGMPGMPPAPGAPGMPPAAASAMPAPGWGGAAPQPPAAPQGPVELRKADEPGGDAR
ncbi:MAG TPA: DUF4328 domain-containing protein [Yinghuangia sp.]|uniref:DUF4328 domain-containing protein n=1 Tax=Yinghuangia sp. YIM S10712 TaxID=3436930 RepID=UPI002B824D42|nr:DUF4328 domain-containing protein [Yinghuangia sp.]